MERSYSGQGTKMEKTTLFLFSNFLKQKISWTSSLQALAFRLYLVLNLSLTIGCKIAILKI
jgi:hypothetical protein